MTNQTTATTPVLAKLEKVTVGFVNLNKKDQFEKYGLQVAFNTLTPELQEKFEPIAYTNKNGEKFISVNSYKALPKEHIIIKDEKVKFINGGDVVTIIVQLNTASNGKVYPEQKMIKFEERPTATNKFADTIAEVSTEALLAMLD